MGIEEGSEIDMGGHTEEIGSDLDKKRAENSLEGDEGATSGEADDGVIKAVDGETVNADELEAA